MVANSRSPVKHVSSFLVLSTSLPSMVPNKHRSSKVSRHSNYPTCFLLSALTKASTFPKLIFTSLVLERSVAGEGGGDNQHHPGLDGG